MRYIQAERFLLLAAAMVMEDFNERWLSPGARNPGGGAGLSFDPHMLRTQSRLLELLSSVSPVPQLLGELAGFVDTWTSDSRCSVMLADASQTCLVQGAAPGLPPELVAEVGSVPIRVGAGSCGTAAARRSLVIVPDIQQSPLWRNYAGLAARWGIQACWSVPFFDDAGALLGTLALYCREPREPTESELDLVQFAARLAAWLVQSRRDAARLQDSEARLSAAIWGTDIGLWESFNDGRCLWVNAWSERFGLPSHLGTDSITYWRSRMHPDDIDRYTHCDDDCIAGKADHYSVDYRIRDREGQWRWVHERGRVMARHPDGVPHQYVGICVDIDERVKTLESLQRAQQRCDLAITASALPMWEYEVPNDSRKGNLHWYRALGLHVSAEEVAARTETWLDGIHPDDIAAHATVFERESVDNDGFYESEYRIRTVTGEYKWFLDRARVVERAPNGRAAKVVGVSLDIDQRKRMEAALVEGEQRLATALWGAKSAPWSTDFISNTSYMSGSFFTMTGIARETWESEVEPWCARVHPDDAPMGCERYRTHLEGRSDVYEHEYRLRTPAGWMWLYDRGQVVERDADGQPLRMVGTTTDMASKKAIERDIVEAVNREQRRISNDLHDGLGQRLTGVSFLLESAMARLSKQAPGVEVGLGEVAGQLREAIGETRALVQGLLPASVERGEILIAIRTHLQEFARTFGVEVDFQQQGMTGIRLPTDTCQHVYRICQEALSNARRHGRAANIIVSLTAEENAFRLSVRDDGCGFDDSNRDRTGLGLKVMEYRAQILGGTVSIRSTPPLGTDVVLRVPLSRECDAAPVFGIQRGACKCVKRAQRAIAAARPMRMVRR